MAETVVTTEPKSRRKEIEEFVRDLDPLQVNGEINNELHIKCMTVCNHNF